MLIKTYTDNDPFPARYAEEWAAFWQIRYAELQAVGQNPDEHNFLADWIPFWGRRVRELALEEVTAKRQQMRRQFGLGEIDQSGLSRP